MQIMIMSELINSLDMLHWRNTLFSPEEEFSENMLVAILEEYEEEDSQEAVQYIIANKLKYTISIHTMQSIFENVKLQKKNVNNKDFITATSFYIENDAYIDFNS